MPHTFLLLNDRTTNKQVRTDEFILLTRPRELLPHYHGAHIKKPYKTARTVSSFTVSL